MLSKLQLYIKLLNDPLIASCLNSSLLPYKIANIGVTKIDYFDFIPPFHNAEANPSTYPKQSKGWPLSPAST